MLKQIEIPKEQLTEWADRQAEWNIAVIDGYMKFSVSEEKKSEYRQVLQKLLNDGDLSPEMENTVRGFLG